MKEKKSSGEEKREKADRQSIINMTFCITLFCFLVDIKQKREVNIFDLDSKQRRLVQLAVHEVDDTVVEVDSSVDRLVEELDNHFVDILRYLVQHV